MNSIKLKNLDYKNITDISELFSKDYIDYMIKKNKQQIRDIHQYQLDHLGQEEYNKILERQSKIDEFCKNPSAQLFIDTLQTAIPNFMIQLWNKACVYLSHINNIQYHRPLANHTTINTLDELQKFIKGTNVIIGTKCRNNLESKLKAAIFILFSNIEQDSNGIYVYDKYNALSLLGKESQGQLSNKYAIIAILRQAGILNEYIMSPIWNGSSNSNNRSTRYYIPDDIVRNFINHYNGTTDIKYGENHIIDIVTGQQALVEGIQSKDKRFIACTVATMLQSFCSFEDYKEACEKFNYIKTEHTKDDIYQYQLVKAINEKDIATLAKFTISDTCGRFYNKISQLKRAYRYRMFFIDGTIMPEIDISNSVMVMMAISLASTNLYSEVSYVNYYPKMYKMLGLYKEKLDSMQKYLRMVNDKIHGDEYTKSISFSGIRWDIACLRNKPYKINTKYISDYDLINKYKNPSTDTLYELRALLDNVIVQLSRQINKFNRAYSNKAARELRDLYIGLDRCDAYECRERVPMLCNLYGLEGTLFKGYKQGTLPHIDSSFDYYLQNIINDIMAKRKKAEDLLDKKIKLENHKYSASYVMKGFIRDANKGIIYYKLAKLGGIVNSPEEFTESIKEQVKKTLMFIINGQRKFIILRYNPETTMLMRLWYAICTYHHGRVAQILNDAKSEYKEELARMILRTESTIMKTIWNKLRYFIPIHDSIKVPLSHLLEAFDAIKSTINETKGFNPSWKLEYEFSNSMAA